MTPPGWGEGAAGQERGPEVPEFPKVVAEVSFEDSGYVVTQSRDGQYRTFYEGPGFKRPARGHRDSLHLLSEISAMLPGSGPGPLSGPGPGP